jgi:hypothetical protein
MAAVTIVNNGVSIKLTIDGRDTIVPKPFKLQVEGDYLRICDFVNKQEYAFLYSDCSSPAAGSATALMNALNLMMASGIDLLEQFSDFNIAITYLDQGAADERINTIVYSSASSGLSSVTMTFGYTGAPGSYSVNSIQFS